jgi:hypothetical protein
MAILIGSARIRFPDFATPNAGVQQLLDRAKTAVASFIKAADQRAFTNSFVEDGTQYVTGSSFIDSKFSDLVVPNKRKIISQVPQVTVLLKKRMFSTLRSNYDLRFMDDEERIFIRAIKNLFRRKAEEIAFYENLIVLEKDIEDPDFLNINNFLDNLLGSFFAIMDLGNSLGLNIDISSIPNLGGLNPTTLFRLKKIQDRAKQNKFTTWIVDPEAMDFAGAGPGVGVLELTWMSSVSTATSLDTGAGKCNIRFEDPYRLTRITEADIDLALKQALSEDQGAAGFFDVTAAAQLEEAQELDRELNGLRRGRGVSEINFEFSPTGSEVFANLIELDQTFTLSNLDDIPDDQALSATEITRVAAIFTRLRSYKSIQDRSVNSIQNSNRHFGVIRSKLRSEFVGHHIIQQMDAIHVFVNSLTRRQTPTYEDRADLLLGNTIATFEEQAGKISDEALEIERQAIAPEMDLWLYKMYRNPVEWRGSGPQVFSGLVTSVDSSYTARDGKFMLNVSASDNIEFLNISRINVQPGLTQPQGVLEDPITPYDLKIDETTGLIIDKKLSQTNLKRLPFLKFDDGPLLGESVENENRLIQNSGVCYGDVSAYQHVPGLVYKWKQGIVTATQEINLTSPLTRNKCLLNDVKDDFGLTLTNSPFDNLDAADVLSILITGQPYNYNNFLQNALDAGNFNIDNVTNNRSYFNFLFDFLERQNPLLGNFVPGKIANIDPEIVADAFRERKKLSNIASRINELQQRRAILQDRLTELNKSNPQDEALAFANQVQSEISALTSQIDAINSTTAATENDLSRAAKFKQFGDAIQVHFKEEDHRLIKKRLQYIVKKKPEEVRFNQDKNYFLVSDKYDTDVDIQAFVLTLKNAGGISLFQNEYQVPKDTCEQVAKIIDFEFFADSQGNIQFRPPQYNKTPLSLLLRMLELSQTDGISIVPPFFVQLLSGRINLIENSILTAELGILEKSQLLGFTNFDIRNRFGINLAIVPGSNGQFSLNSNILRQSLQTDAIFTEKQQTDAVFNPPKTLAERDAAEHVNDSSFVIPNIISIRNQLLELRGSTSPRLNPDNIEDRKKVEKELLSFEAGNPKAFVNRLNLTNSIAQLVSERQTLAKVYEKLVDENREINALGSGSNINIFNFLGQTARVEAGGGIPGLPRSLEDFIENDLANMDGFNSGKRFIIEDDVILEMNFSIRKPEFTRIDVNGDTNLIGQKIKNNIPLAFWAGATDFDLWRQFGFRVAPPVHKAFLQDPETQCAPYAVFKLLQQRKKIHSGSITVVGNEFYQPGDVVYINNRQMLYYVNSVQHNVSVATGAFTTTLELTYGHAIGEYIPTPLDIIGRGMLSNSQRAYGNSKAIRAIVPSANIIHLETFSFPLTAEVNDVSTQLFFTRNQNVREGFANEQRVETLFNRRFRPNAVAPERDFNPELTERFNDIEAQFKTINFSKAQNAIRRAASRINKNNQDTFKIEVRGYTLGDTESIARTRIFLSFAVKLLTEGLLPQGGVSISPDLQIHMNSSVSHTSSDILHIDRKHIIAVDPINLQDPLTEEQAALRRMPSSQAWANSSNIDFNNSQGLPINSIDIVLVVNKITTSDTDIKAPSAGHSTKNPTIPSSQGDFPIRNSDVENIALV